MILVPKGQSYTLGFYLPARADATPTATVYSPGGGSLQTPTVTLDTVSTTLSGAASAGATSVTVASATGITAGRRYLIGGGEDAGGETITVKSVASTTVNLVRALRFAVSSGASFVGHRATLSLSSIDTADRHYRAEVAWAVSSVTQAPFVLAFDVTKYTPRSGLTAEDIRDFDPILNKRLPQGLWIPAVIDQAWSMILAQIASKVDPGGLVGALDLTVPHAYLTRALILEASATSAETAAEVERFYQRFSSTFDTALASAAIDNDQDGRIEPNEGWYRSIPVMRG